MIWTAIEGRKSSPSPRSQAAPKSRISPKTGGRFIRRVAPGPVSCASLNRTAKAKRGTVWADIHGDKRSDLLVAEPESGQLTVFVQQDDGTLGPGKTFPTLTGISEVAVGDWDGDDRPEIFVLSVDERQIGLTRFDRGGRVTFPKVLPIEGRTLVMDVGVLKDNGKLALAVSSDLDGERELQILEEGGKLRRQALNASFKSNPRSVTIHDANQDGLNDVVVLIPYEKIKVLVQVPDKDFVEADIAPPGGSVELPWVSASDVDGDGKSELLLAQKNFLRAVVLETPRGEPVKAKGVEWSFTVKEQINGAASNSRIVGAAALRNATNPVPSIFLLDAERKALTLCERDPAGVWQVVRNLPLAVSDFQGLQAVRGESSQTASLGQHRGWMTCCGGVWELADLDGYESPSKTPSA